MANGKAAGGGDSVVVEMIKLLPIAAVYVVTDLFQRRYAGSSFESILSWTKIVLVFINKISKPKQMKDFRGISLLSVMSKWYMGCLCILAKSAPKPAL